MDSLDSQSRESKWMCPDLSPWSVMYILILYRGQTPRQRCYPKTTLLATMLIFVSEKTRKEGQERLLIESKISSVLHQVCFFLFQHPPISLSLARSNAVVRKIRRNLLATTSGMSLSKHDVITSSRKSRVILTLQVRWRFQRTSCARGISYVQIA